MLILIKALSKNSITKPRKKVIFPDIRDARKICFREDSRFTGDLSVRATFLL